MTRQARARAKRGLDMGWAQGGNMRVAWRRASVAIERSKMRRRPEKMEAMERRVGWESDKGDPIRWFLFYFRGSKSNMAEKGDSYSTLGAKSRIRARRALLSRTAFGFGAEMNRM